VETQLEGRWQMVRAELAGEAAPELVTEHTVVTLAAGRYEVRFDDEVADSGTYREDAATEPATIILHGTVGPNAGRTIPCIFQLMGDRLRVCYGLDGLMPEAFATRPGELRYLVTYRRLR
jgi:uncharacterized protein (TIGR03067 family)